MRRGIHPLIALLLLAMCFVAGYALRSLDAGRASAAPMRIEHFNSPEHARLELPFSEAVRVDDVVFTAVIGNVPGTLKLVDGGIEAETKQCMENLKRVLEANGSSLDHVVKCTVMLTDMNDWKTMNAVYGSYFEKDLPARASFGVTALAIGARVEIDCIATVASR